MKRGTKTEPWTIRVQTIHEGTPHACDRFVLYLHKATFGKRSKKYFRKKKDAIAHAKRELADLRAHGQKATQLTDVERASAVKAINLLRDSACHETLEEVANYYIKHRPSAGDATVREVVLKFLAERGVAATELDKPGKHRSKEARQKEYKGNSLRHRTSLTSRLRPLVEKWGDKMIRLVSSQPDAFVAWMRDELPKKVRRKPPSYPDASGALTRVVPPKRTRGKSQGDTSDRLQATTIDNFRRTIHSVFKFAMDRKLCADNPAKRWDELKKEMKQKKKAHKPGILQPAELEKLLTTAEKNDKIIVAGLAIGAFSGIRTEEISRLTWGMIKKEIIHLPATITKTRTAADIKISQTLAAWLSKAPKGSPEELVAPKDFDKRRREQCRIIGLQWPSNALRHSFGSYRYAASKDIASTAFEMRHEDIATFRRWYLNRGITEDMAKEYFSVVP